MQKNRKLPEVVLPGLTKSFSFANFIAKGLTAENAENAEKKNQN
jgi:hypothetical protein